MTLIRSDGARLPAAIGLQLEPGDRLESPGPGHTISLSCGENAELKFWDVFHVLVVGADSGAQFAVELKKGRVIAVSAGGPGIQGGGVTLGSPDTIYELDISEDGSPVTTVYSGSVVLSSAAGSRKVEGGNRLAGVQGSPVPVSEAEYNTAAAVLTRFTVAKAQLAGTQIAPAEVSELRQTYAHVLRNPRDADAQIKLAGQEVRFSAPQTALTFLKLAEKVAVPTEPSRARIEVTRAAAYQRLGDAERFEMHYANAVRLDPEVKTLAGRLFVSNLRAIAVTPATMRIQATAMPPSPAQGENVRIQVTARSADNSPLAGVQVTVGAGAGIFRESGRAQATGATDARGQFAVTWSCAACRGTYTISANATRSGFGAASAEVTLRVGNL